MGRRNLTPACGAACAAILALFAAPAALAEEALTYVLTPDFSRGVLRVELTWETAGRGKSTLGVSPRWGPIDDVPALIRKLDIDAGGASAPIERDGAMWHIPHRQGARLRVRYEVDPGVRAFDDWSHTHHPITGPDFFHGMGNAFLLTPQPGNRIPRRYQTVMRWVLPAGHEAACSWGVGRHVGDTLDASDLRHSIYVAGKLSKHTLEREGRSISVVLAGDLGFDAAKFAEFSERIIAAQCAFMGEREFPPFVVTAAAIGPPLREGELRISGNGLYHSFALQLAPSSKLDDGVQHLFAHELFHYWNGRKLEAADPERLVFWFTEGFTDYYALRILFESGIWDARTYAKWLNKHLREYALNPARNATNADIQERYWSERATVGEAAYQRGLLLGLRWQRMARAQGVKSGVDALLFALLARAESGAFRVSNDNLRSLGIETLGKWFGAEFDRYVVRADTIELPADVLSPALAGETIETFAYELGFKQSESLRGKRVTGLKPGSAAAAAGLREGDVLSAWRVPGNADEPTRLTVKRGERSIEIEYLARGAATKVLQFRPGDAKAAPPRATSKPAKKP